MRPKVHLPVLGSFVLQDLKVSWARFPSHWCHGVVRHLGGRAHCSMSRCHTDLFEGSWIQARRHKPVDPLKGSPRPQAALRVTLMAPDFLCRVTHQARPHAGGLPALIPGPLSESESGLACAALLARRPPGASSEPGSRFTRALASAAGLTVAQLKELQGTPLRACDTPNGSTRQLGVAIVALHGCTDVTRKFFHAYCTSPQNICSGPFGAALVCGASSAWPVPHRPTSAPRPA
jgi:hypothetical protein